mmetsp:Transcript_10416/g.39402  ORF Transcript_10416/g.39402 Transcript_10416/m.39402 type:complete len:219 (+) Transcript_10416:584-1240(+)
MQLGVVHGPVKAQGRIQIHRLLDDFIVLGTAAVDINVEALRKAAPRFLGGAILFGLGKAPRPRDELGPRGRGWRKRMRRQSREPGPESRHFVFPSQQAYSNERVVALCPHGLADEVCAERQRPGLDIHARRRIGVVLPRVHRHFAVGLSSRGPPPPQVLRDLIADLEEVFPHPVHVAHHFLARHVLLQRAAELDDAVAVRSAHPSVGALRNDGRGEVK